MKAGVVTFPGSNCDDDAVYSLARTAGLRVDRLWHKDSPDLKDYDLIVLPGGFSYGDYLRSGAIASVSPVMESIRDYARRGGLLMGICNGFQILCEAGLLPGALARNSGLLFSCRDVELLIESTENPWFDGVDKGQTLILPIAHGDGRYVIDEISFEELKRNHQILLVYAENPNGSVHAIAGVCNKERNVFGLMPHPERATDLRSGHGKIIWNSIQRHMQRGSA